MFKCCQVLPVLIFCALTCSAQNLETIGKEKPLKISGGVSLSQIMYSASGIDSRRAPYSYFASGNVNFSLYGLNVPVSFSLSNQSVTFQQPFNQFALHPTYKWITAHAGFISMSYSPYTVNGHLFNGGAVDLAPADSKFKFSALYGRFLRAVEPDTLNKNVQPSFRRMGAAFKVAYGDAQNFAEATFFHAKDDINSISYIPVSQGILPQENFVVGIGGGKTLLKHLMAKAEFASSAITRDIRSAGTESNSVLAQTPILTPQLSTSYYNAMKGSLAYQGSGYTVGIGYERIDPQYRTLGAYFFNNDLENITANAATSLLQGKVNLAVTGGTQHDNLDNSKISTMHRFVGSANVAYAPSQKLNLSASYSSFQTFTNIRSQFVNINRLTPYDNLDTLRFTQISQNASVNGIYMFGSNKNRRQNLNLNLTIQDAADVQAGIPQNSGVRFYNANSAYSLTLVPQNMTLTGAFNATINDGAGTSSRTFGPTLAISRSFFEKKFRTTGSFSMNQSYTNGQHLGDVSIGRISGTASLAKVHNINLGLVVVNRDNLVDGSAKSFTEFTGTLGYSYSFSK